MVQNNSASLLSSCVCLRHSRATYEITRQITLLLLIFYHSVVARYLLLSRIGGSNRLNNAPRYRKREDFCIKMLRQQSLRSLVIIFATLATCCSADDCESQDEALLAPKQQFNIEFEWLISARDANDSGRVVETIVEELLYKLLPDDNVKIASTKGSVTSLKNEAVFETRHAISTNSKLKSTNVLSDDLLLTLKTLVNCDKPCLSENMSEYSLYSGEKIKTSTANYPAFINIGRVRVLLSGSKNQTVKASNLTCEEFCDQISAAKSNSEEFSLVDLHRKAYSTIMKIVHSLDPQKWLILIVSMWLVTCLVIAMQIKRQDRSKLRLHLQERAEYSFSKPRDRP